MGHAAYSTYTIGQLARAAGVPTSTVRYYERIGLLHPSGRTAGNYRVYGAEALKRVRFIRAAQTTGFTLADIMALLHLQDDGTPARCCDVQILIEARLADLAQQLAALHHVREVLTASLTLCRQSQHEDDRCAVLDQLTASCPPSFL
jgi:MerR family mercuric resistance operon transcriptional regulator